MRPCTATSAAGRSTSAPARTAPREASAGTEATKPAKPDKGARPRPRSARTPPKSSNAKEQQRLEREIEAAEASLKALEQELSDPGAWSTPQRSASATARHQQAKDTVDELYQRWERIAG